MTVRHLRIFQAVCQKESITAAAEQLNMTQPAVSIAVRELESYYRTRLFDRIGRRIRLTESGTLLRQYADSILEQFDEAAVVLRDQSRSRRCRLAVNVTVGETMLSAILAALRQAIPELQPEITVNHAPVIGQKLTAGEVDLAVTDGLAPLPELAFVPFSAEEMLAVCAPDFPVPDSPTLEALSALPLLLREAKSGNREAVDSTARTKGIVLRPILESASDLCLLQAAENGLGIALLPKKLVQQELDTGRLRAVPLTDAVFRREYSLVWNRKKYQPEVVRKAISALTPQT